MPSFFPPVSPAGFVTMLGAKAKTTVTGTTEASLLPDTGSTVGSRIIPAGTLKPGVALRVILGGNLDTALVPGTGTFRVKLNGTTVVSGATVSLLGSASGGGFSLTSRMQCMAEGVTGVMNFSGKAEYPSGLLSTKSSVDLHKDGQVVDTTVDQTIDVTFQSSVAANTIRVLTATIEMLPA